MVPEILNGSRVPGYLGQGKVTSTTGLMQTQKKKILHHTASAFTKQSQRESVMGSRQCGKLMKSLIRVCEAAVGVTLTIAFS